MAKLLSDSEKNREYYNVVMENARLCFAPNFSGTGSDFNQEGSRNFTVVVDDPRTKMSKRWVDRESGKFMVQPITADDLANDGWNVKIRTPNGEGNDSFRFIRVMVKFNHDNPRMNPSIFLSTGDGPEVELNEKTVHRLDKAVIKYVDIEFRTHYWTSKKDGSSGVNGYLTEGHFLIDQGAFGDKYQTPIDDEEE